MQAAGCRVAGLGLPGVGFGCRIEGIFPALKFPGRFPGSRVRQAARGKSREACASAVRLTSPPVTRPGSGAFWWSSLGTRRGSGRAAARGPVSRQLRRPHVTGLPPCFIMGWGLVRACLSILELCEWFRDSSQASGASQRVQRASDALPLIGRCAGWPCTPWPFARPQPECRFASMSSVTRLVARVHSLACAVTVRLGVASSLLRCAPRVASGCYAGRSGLSVRRSGASRFMRGASDSGGARAYLIGARATPTLLTLRPHVLQPARSGARGAAPLFLRVAVLRAPARRSVGGAAGRALPCASLRSGSRGSAGYLVDPASSHMLVSKIKPCMSKYKRLVL